MVGRLQVRDCLRIHQKSLDILIQPLIDLRVVLAVGYRYNLRVRTAVFALTGEYDLAVRRTGLVDGTGLLVVVTRCRIQHLAADRTSLIHSTELIAIGVIPGSSILVLRETTALVFAPVNVVTIRFLIAVRCDRLHEHGRKVRTLGTGNFGLLVVGTLAFALNRAVLLGVSVSIAGFRNHAGSRHMLRQSRHFLRSHSQVLGQISIAQVDVMLNSIGTVAVIHRTRIGNVSRRSTGGLGGDRSPGMPIGFNCLMAAVDVLLALGTVNTLGVAHFSTVGSNRSNFILLRVIRLLQTVDQLRSHLNAGGNRFCLICVRHQGISLNHTIRTAAGVDNLTVYVTLGLSTYEAPIMAQGSNGHLLGHMPRSVLGAAFACTGVNLVAILGTRGLYKCSAVFLNPVVAILVVMAQLGENLIVGFCTAAVAHITNGFAILNASRLGTLSARPIMAQGSNGHLLGHMPRSVLGAAFAVTGVNLVACISTGRFHKCSAAFLNPVVAIFVGMAQCILIAGFRLQAIRILTGTDFLAVLGTGGRCVGIVCPSRPVMLASLVIRDGVLIQFGSDIIRQVNRLAVAGLNDVVDIAVVTVEGDRTFLLACSNLRSDRPNMTNMRVVADIHTFQRSLDLLIHIRGSLHLVEVVRGNHIGQITVVAIEGDGAILLAGALLLGPGKLVAFCLDDLVTLDPAIACACLTSLAEIASRVAIFGTGSILPLVVNFTSMVNCRAQVHFRLGCQATVVDTRQCPVTIVHASGCSIIGSIDVLVRVSMINLANLAMTADPRLTIVTVNALRITNFLTGGVLLCHFTCALMAGRLQKLVGFFIHHKLDRGMQICIAILTVGYSHIIGASTIIALEHTLAGFSTGRSHSLRSIFNVVVTSGVNVFRASLATSGISRRTDTGEGLFALLRASRDVGDYTVVPLMTQRIQISCWHKTLGELRRNSFRNLCILQQLCQNSDFRSLGNFYLLTASAFTIGILTSKDKLTITLTGRSRVHTCIIVALGRQRHDLRLSACRIIIHTHLMAFCCHIAHGACLDDVTSLFTSGSSRNRSVVVSPLIQRPQLSLSHQFLGNVRQVLIGRGLDLIGGVAAIGTGEGHGTFTCTGGSHDHNIPLSLVVMIQLRQRQDFRFSTGCIVMNNNLVTFTRLTLVTGLCDVALSQTGGGRCDDTLLTSFAVDPVIIMISGSQVIIRGLAQQLLNTSIQSRIAVLAVLNRHGHSASIVDALVHKLARLSTGSGHSLRIIQIIYVQLLCEASHRLRSSLFQLLIDEAARQILLIGGGLQCVSMRRIILTGVNNVTFRVTGCILAAGHVEVMPHCSNIGKAALVHLGNNSIGHTSHTRRKLVGSESSGVATTLITADSQLALRSTGRSQSDSDFVVVILLSKALPQVIGNDGLQFRGNLLRIVSGRCKGVGVITLRAIIQIEFITMIDNGAFLLTSSFHAHEIINIDFVTPRFQTCDIRKCILLGCLVFGCSTFPLQSFLNRWMQRIVVCFTILMIRHDHTFRTIGVIGVITFKYELTSFRTSR